MIQTKACPNCKCDQGRVLLDVSREKDTYLDHLQSKGFLQLDYQNISRKYIECIECGLVYRTPVLDDREKAILYDHFRDIEIWGIDKKQYFEKITSLPPEQSENTEKCRWIAHYIPAKGTLLDVGTGGAVFPYSFKQHFPKWETWGVEPTQGFADVAKEKGVHIIYGYLDENTIDRSFDLVALNHVLEHIESPKNMLTMLKKYVKGGNLYVEVPSVKDIGYLPSSHDRFMCQHEVIFSKKLLERLLKETGYQVVAAEDFISIRNRNNIRVIAKI